MPDSKYIVSGILRFLPFILLFTCCDSENHDSSDEFPQLYPAPQAIPVKTVEGYITNPMTGDTIQALINSLGDTLKTGISIPALGYVVDASLLEAPSVVPAGKAEVTTVRQNKHKIPDDLTVIPVNKDSLRSYIPGIDIFWPHTLVNSTGDTIPTGVPIPIQGRIVACRTPKPVTAQLPGQKANARLNIKYLDLAQGMNSSYISSIIEDSRGNLWFGTWGGGASKYNGESFTHYTQEVGLSSNEISSIIEDSQGNLWFGSQGGGVSMYNGHHFTHFTEKEGLSNNEIRSLLEDQQGNIWIGTWDGGVSMYDGEAITHFSTAEGLGSMRVFDIGMDKHGNIWMGTQGGVNMYDGERFTLFSGEDGLIYPIVWCVEEDSQGNMWFGTNLGLSKYDGNSFTNYTKKEGLIANFIWQIFEDSRGRLWFGSMDGVSMFTGESFTNFTEKEGLRNNQVIRFFEDSRGNLWFSNLGGGVSIYNPQPIVHLTEEDGLHSKFISSILEDSQGRLWFASKGNGISMYNGKTFSHFTREQGIGGNFVETIYEDSQKNLWLGTDAGGIVKYDGKAFTQYTENGDLIRNIIYSICEDHMGNYWFGTWDKGIIKYDGQSFTHYGEKEGFSNNNMVTAILEDRQGKLWFGSGKGGLSSFDGKDFIHYSQREGLSNHAIWCMLEDSQGRLWFGSEGGAIMYNGNTFSHFTKKEGLSDNNIYSMLEDNMGNIWMGTLKGLNCLVFGSDAAPGKGDGFSPLIMTYNGQDGLKGVDFNINSIELDRKNQLWLGTGKCLTMIDLNNFSFPAEAPVHMQLDRIELNEEFIDFRHLDRDLNGRIEFTEVASFHNLPLMLKLPHKFNHLTFHYSAIDWFAPHKIMYSYKIEGLEDDWSMPSSETKADYRNLPSGTHTFKVRATGAARIWSEPFEYKFTVKPPWWFSWWAYLIYGMILIFIILQYRRFLLRRADLQSAIEIERIEKEKVLELDHMKSRFFANISHEFRTPLTLLLGPINDLLIKPDRIMEDDRKLLRIMKRNAMRLQQLINQLLDLSRLETGKLKLEVADGNLTGFIRSIVLSFLSLAESKKIQYSYKLEESSTETYFDEDKIEKILTNLLSNALKFTPEGGSILVSFQYIREQGPGSDFRSVLKVMDTGPGIPGEQQEKIFNRFYQLDNTDARNHEGSGIGLALVKELVELYRGSIELESSPGRGSTFTLTLPVSRDLFKEEEIVSRQQKKKEPILPDDPHSESDQILQQTKDQAVILIVEDNQDLREYISPESAGQIPYTSGGKRKKRFAGSH